MLRKVVQAVYNRTIRPYLPRKLGHLNRVTTRMPRLFDATDVVERAEAIPVFALRHHTRPGDRVVILGGGHGVTTVHASIYAGEEGEVRVFEGSREHVDIVTEALELNPTDAPIDVTHAVVGDPVEVWGSTQEATQLDPSELPECDVLEIDIEGAEFSVLDGLEIRPRVIIVESHPHHGSTAEGLRMVLTGMGYEARIWGAGEKDMDVAVGTLEGEE